MAIELNRYPKAVMVSFHQEIVPATVQMALDILLSEENRSCRVLFDIRNTRWLGTMHIGALVYMNAQLRKAHFSEAIGLWIIEHPHVEQVLNGARLDSAFVVLRSENEVARFVGVQQL